MSNDVIYRGLKLVRAGDNNVEIHACRGGYDRSDDLWTVVLTDIDGAKRWVDANFCMLEDNFSNGTRFSFDDVPWFIHRISDPVLRAHLENVHANLPVQGTWAWRNDAFKLFCSLIENAPPAVTSITTLAGETGTAGEYLQGASAGIQVTEGAEDAGPPQPHGLARAFGATLFGSGTSK